MKCSSDGPGIGEVGKLDSVPGRGMMISCEPDILLSKGA